MPPAPSLISPEKLITVLTETSYISPTNCPLFPSVISPSTTALAVAPILTQSVSPTVAIRYGSDIVKLPAGMLVVPAADAQSVLPKVVI